jgi:outer membrane protein TolC
MISRAGTTLAKRSTDGALRAMKHELVCVWMLVWALELAGNLPSVRAAQTPGLPSPAQPPAIQTPVGDPGDQPVQGAPRRTPPGRTQQRSEKAGDQAVQIVPGRTAPSRTEPPLAKGQRPAAVQVVPGNRAPSRTLLDEAVPGQPSPLATTPKLISPFEPGDLRFPITLAAALRLSDARPLIVAAAQARVWVAEGELAHAKALWMPDLNIGGDYVRHDGGGPDFNKGIMTAPSVNFLYAGVGLWGNQYGIIPIPDAIYQPLVARQVLNSRHWEVQGAKNDALLMTADAYFAVHRYRGMYAGALYTVGRGHDVVQRISELSRDLAPAYEVDRARNMLADLQQQAVMARQEWRVKSAALTRILRLDPRAVLEPLEHDHLQMTLVDPGKELDELMPIALHNRPEIAARRALVQSAEIAVRREVYRPFIPVVALTGFQTPFELIQAGIFGLGPNSSLNQWTGRDDFSIQPLLQFRNLGFGNLALAKTQRGMESLAIVDLFDAQDKVAEEVFQALARVQSAALRVVLADRALRTGLITFNGSLEGLAQTSRFGDVLVLVSRPQETVYALQLMKTAFDEYFTTVAEYNRAQFELFHALGYPAGEIAQLRPPGEAEPVNLERPAFLPPVGNGPPPATR